MGCVKSRPFVDPELRRLQKRTKNVRGRGTRSGGGKDDGDDDAIEVVSTSDSDDLSQYGPTLLPGSGFESRSGESSVGSSSARSTPVGKLCVRQDEIDDEGDFLVEFTADEMRRATKGFISQVGEESSATLYRGRIRRGDGRVAEVVVRALRAGAALELHDFVREIAIWGETRHENVVHLYGYCFEGETQMLVYEHTKGGSLGQRVFGGCVQEGLQVSKPDGEALARPLLSYWQRMRVLVGAAQGLMHLQQEKCNKGGGQGSVYEDLSISHILLDENLTPKLAGYGFYDPVWHDPSKPPPQGCQDLLSFGRIIVEVLSGRQSPPTTSQHSSFLLWAREALACTADGGRGILDPSIAEHAPEKSVKIALAAAKACLEEDPALRVSMPRIVETLKVAYAHAISS